MDSPRRLNVHRCLELDYGRDCLKKFRELEKCERLIARFRSHLHFSLHCLHCGIVPRSIKLKTSVRGHRACEILRQTEHVLLSERIRQINYRIGGLNSEKTDLDEWLFTRLPSDRFDEIRHFVHNASRAEAKICKAQQRRKYDDLVYKQQKSKEVAKSLHIPPEETKAVKDRWVINKSDHQLSEPEHTLLQNGLNFAVTPTSLPTDELITSVESATKCVGLDSDEASEIRSKASELLRKAKLPKSNITQQERETIKSLKDNKDIMVIPADKGRAVVVMNTRKYKSKSEELLEDNKTYKKRKSNPTSRYKTKLIKILQGVKQSGTISETKYRQLYPTSEEVPKFYGLPKVHKNSCPLRPIVACRGSISYDVAKFTADITSPLVGQYGHHLQNSKDLVDKLQNFQLESGEVLVSYDVTALFTCTPVQESLAIIKERLCNDNTLADRTDLSVDQVMSLLEYCLTTTYFQYDGQFFNNLKAQPWGRRCHPLLPTCLWKILKQKRWLPVPTRLGSGGAMSMIPL